MGISSGDPEGPEEGLRGVELHRGKRRRVASSSLISFPSAFSLNLFLPLVSSPLSFSELSLHTL